LTISAEEIPHTISAIDFCRGGRRKDQLMDGLQFLRHFCKARTDALPRDLSENPRTPMNGSGDTNQSAARELRYSSTACHKERRESRKYH